MRFRSDRRRIVELTLFLLFTPLFCGTLALSAAAADDAAAMLEKDVRVMEGVLDQILVDSPNVLVSSAGTTRGLVLDQYGAVFTLEVSLDLGKGGLWALGDYAKDLALAKGLEKKAQEEEFKAQQEASKAEEEASKAGEGEEKQADTFASLDKLGEESRKAREKHLENFKVELQDALLKYGPTLSELDDSKWVTVVAFLDGRGLYLGDSGFLFGGDTAREKLTRLTLKVKMGDLRQFSAGRLSREQAAKKVIVEQV
jgi:hypothetical protein